MMPRPYHAALLLAGLLIHTTGASAQEHVHHHSSDRAPIGVMGDHTHNAGEWMLSYRYMTMEMRGNRDGSDRIGVSEVLDDFRVAPTDMTMDMHMLGIMWAPNNDLTLMLMLPWIENEMDHRTRMGGRFTTESDGLGDIKATALVRLRQWRGQQVHLNAGISLPTGSIDEKDDTPMGRVRLPYPMQLGSGTIDLMPGITYLGHRDAISWGGQVEVTYRLGENDNDYTLGNRARATAWGAYRWCDWFSSSLRIDAVDWENIDGADPRLDPTLVPTADPDRRGGSRVNIGLGGNLSADTGVLADHRLAFEVAWPIEQDLDGPQLETDWTMLVGWQRVW